MKSFKTLIAVFCISFTSFAQNYTDALLLSEAGLYNSARALGLGNSYTALSDDYSAVVFNPAGLGLVKKMGLSVTLNDNLFDNLVSFQGNNSSSLKNSVNLNQFGLIFPVPTVRGSLVFALGYNRVKEFNSIAEFDGFNSNNTSMIQHITGDINDVIPITNEIRTAYEIRNPNTKAYIKDTTLISGMLNQSGRIKTEGSIGNWSFAVSNEIAKGLFIGGTFNILNGSYKKDRDYYEDDSQNNYDQNTELVPGDVTTKDFETFYLNDIVEWDLSGWDLKLGMLYNWIDFLKIGATIKFPSHYNIKESYYVTTSSEFGTGTRYNLNAPIIDNIEYKIKTPFEYSAGASIKVLILNVSGEVKLIDYTQMEFTEGFGREYRIERNKEIDDLFGTAITYHLGVEVQVPFLPIWGRAGAMYVQSPYADDPADFDKKYLTAGVGIRFGDTFSLDFAYAYGWWSDYIDNYDSQVSRVYYDINVHNILLTLTTGFN